jgi:hypothetical protein
MSMIWLLCLMDWFQVAAINASKHRDAQWFVLTLLLVLHWAAPQIDAHGQTFAADEGAAGVSNYERSSLPAAMPRSLPRCRTVELRLPKEEQVVLPAGEKACVLQLRPIPGLAGSASETIVESASRLQLAFLRNYYSRAPPDRVV